MALRPDLTSGRNKPSAFGKMKPLQRNTLGVKSINYKFTNANIGLDITKSCFVCSLSQQVCESDFCIEISKIISGKIVWIGRQPW